MGAGPTGATPQRVEALPGLGRYSVTFRRADGGEQSAVVEVAGDGETVTAAEASLPSGWTRDSAAFAATARVVLALHAARASAEPAPALMDVDGGWDVGLGNVVLADGTPTCTAHGPMAADGEVYECAECGARARLAAG